MIFVQIFVIKLLIRNVRVLHRLTLLGQLKILPSTCYYCHLSSSACIRSVSVLLYQCIHDRSRRKPLCLSSMLRTSSRCSWELCQNPETFSKLLHPLSILPSQSVEFVDLCGKFLARYTIRISLHSSLTR